MSGFLMSTLTFYLLCSNHLEIRIKMWLKAGKAFDLAVKVPVSLIRVPGSNKQFRF